MYQSVSDRIQQRMTELDLSQADLMRSTGAARGTVSGWVNGSNNPSAKHIEALSKALKTTSHWLLTGEISGSFHTDQILETVVTNDEIRDHFVWIEVVEANFSCGEGESIEFHFDAINGKIPFPPSFLKDKNVTEQTMKIIKAKGDSMADFIKDGDLVGINLSQTNIIDGEIYAVYLAGEGMIKQIFKEADGSLILHSLNEKYRDKVVTEENGKNFKVMGRQIWRAG
ncbi:XRE family transcriptional regulator [Acinetobacter lwoffii]|uniref:XRE family transcriptional regulator n=1 Tax=Acinetobacter lwoffii TaxID=28090 RepID=UPI003F8DC892